MSPNPPKTESRERRQHKRAPYQAGVEIEWGAAILRGQASDISAGGMLIELPDPLWMGAEFQARFPVHHPGTSSLRDVPTVRVACRVCRIIPGQGMGVEFVELKEEDRARVQELVKKLAP